METVGHYFRELLSVSDLSDSQLELWVLRNQLLSEGNKEIVQFGVTVYNCIQCIT